MGKYKISFKGKEFEASPYQEAIFDNIEHGVGNMIIQAAAGSAKTTTIVNSINIIPDNKSILFIAFNKDIVEEIRNRIGSRKNTKISTFHSMGFSIFIENNAGVNPDNLVNEFKYKNYIKSNIDTITSYGETKSLKRNRGLYLKNIIDLTEYSRYYLAFKEREISKVAEKYGIVPLRDEIEVCKQILIWGKNNISQIDYTDMVWLPTVLNYTTNKYRYNWILIDEAQDVTIAEQKLVEKCYKRGCRIVTTGDESQMINIWCGSDEEAINNFAKMPNTKKFSLPISYRCPKKVVELARKYSDNIIAKDDAIEGEVRYNVSKNSPKNGDMVLCRITAPLIDLHMHYLRINKKSYIRGWENIRDTYLSLIKATNSKTIDKQMLTSNGLIPELYKMLFKAIDSVKTTFGLDDEDSLMHPSVMSIYDAINGIKVLAEGVTEVDDLIDKVNTIFQGGSENGIQLSTVHKAKGLEADNVFILLPSLMPIKYAKKEWELKTEKNLIYVAVTRAKKTLNYIEEEKRLFGKPQNTFDNKQMASDIATARKIIEKNSDIGIREVVIKKEDEVSKPSFRKPLKLGEKREYQNVGEKPTKKKAADKFRKLME